jgi:hypothetical protein
MSCINDGSFVIAELRIKEKGVLPLKGGLHDLNPKNIKEA